MRGEVLTYDDGPGVGLISGDDGARYTFARADLQQLTPVRAGMKVDFVPVESVATEVIIIAGQWRAYGSGYVPGVAGSGATFDATTLFLQPAGRIGLRDYWIGMGVIVLAWFLLTWIPLIGTVVALFVIYAGICISSKRLHDMGKSGWLAVFPYGILAVATVFSVFAVIGAILGSGGDGFGILGAVGGIFGLWMLAILVNLGFLVWLGATPGDPHDNAYGPPPQPLAEF